MSEPTSQRPTRPAAAVIRSVRAGDWRADRPALWRRTLPVLVTSGGVHLVLIALFVALFGGDAARPVVADDAPVAVEVEQPPEEEQPPLDIPDIGLDPIEPPGDPIEQMPADEPVEPPTGQPAEGDAPPGMDQPADAPNAPGVEPRPNGVAPSGGGAGPGNPFRARDQANKAKALGKFGGTSATEAAVGLGLVYLARKQKPDGRWVYDGKAAPDVVAATAMCLLPFLAAGETHRGGVKYTKNVDAGLKFLLARQRASGELSSPGGTQVMYTHAIATVALCEAYGMTRDPALKRPAQAAVNFVIRAQGVNGSWGYSAGSTGDTGIVGWQVQALKSARLAGLAVDDNAFRRAGNFLDSVSTAGNSRYGYTSRGDKPSLTAVSLLSRVYIPPGWGPRNLPLGKGVEFLLKEALPKPGQPLDMYTVYYATQVVFFHGGQAWSRDWNPRVREALLAAQAGGAGPDRGSWAADPLEFGASCGRLGTTCLALLTLEVYYRHLPLYQRDTGGLKELD